MYREIIKKKVLITGSKGQLGQCLRKITNYYPDIDIHFTSSDDLDITQKLKMKHFFSDKKFDFVINCAAYTKVEKAEKEPQKAFAVNTVGVRNLAEICMENNIVLIHISTDYVFDGKKTTPYTEEDNPNPINKYGKSKLAGEKEIQSLLQKYFIIRTSWLYSEYGNNFFKMILNKSETEKEMSITTSETGTPTNSYDLANFILELTRLNSSKYGIYHYSNLGETTWFDFAIEILRQAGKIGSIILKKTDNYSTFAARPKYSVLNKEKCIKIFEIDIPDWKRSLETIIKC